VLVEGGGRVHGSFLQQRLVDEVYLFTAPLFIGESGTPLVQGYTAENPVDRVRLIEVESEQLGSDTLIQGIVAGRG
jgi:diaminohydroxyphosphoribosylaminopyrimidine deaminase/5-amino-6-(5-phosphoribosylamino)uracil reductase